MTDTQIAEALRGMQRVAVVGLSPRQERASHGISRWLLGSGVDVVGVNPGHEEILGVPVYPSLADVPGPVDIVDIFRRGETVGPIVADAVSRRDGLIWMQEGVVNPEAARVASEAGVPVIMDRCIYKEYLRLLNG